MKWDTFLGQKMVLVLYGSFEVWVDTPQSTIEHFLHSKYIVCHILQNILYYFAI